MTITVRRSSVSARLASPNSTVTSLIRRTVPSTARESDVSSKEWVIFASKVEKLIAALRSADHDVVVETPTGGAF